MTIDDVTATVAPAGTAGTAEVILQVNDVVKRWDASSGLPPVSFTLARGEILVVRGRSGTGKSTLLSILAGWCEQDTGTIERRGDWAAAGAWRRWDRTAVVPQVLALLPELSAVENVTLAARLRTSNERDARRLAEEMIDALDLGMIARRSPAEASVGQQQRLALARAVVAGPTLLLVDEPTSHQDDHHAERVIAAIRGSAEAGAGAIVVTHDPRLDGHADQIVMLSALDPIP